MWWAIAWDVAYIHSTISCKHSWEVITDADGTIRGRELLPAEKAMIKEKGQGVGSVSAPEFAMANPEVEDWSKDT